jgi:hypothetical protein
MAHSRKTGEIMGQGAEVGLDRHDRQSGINPFDADDRRKGLGIERLSSLP